MKKLTCEMCGSTDLVKQDGVFVCQSCGSKYSVEEAKKMMVEGTVEIQGSVQVSNAAQLDNLLQLAYSSYNSKNYAQAEEFCNQVIAMDGSNFDAWKLKGEAINFQITGANDRITEVYNCIMTSYEVLDDAGKDEKRDNILKSLRVCLEGEIDFALDLFNNNRPTGEMLTKVKNTFINCASNVITSYKKLGYPEEEADTYRTSIKNYFIQRVNDVCNQTWKDVVLYNYYRGGWSDEYRPNTEIFRTLLTEGDNIVALLRFSEGYFNEKTPAINKRENYGLQNKIQIELRDAKSYKRMVSTTTNGYGAVTSRHEYWEVDRELTAESWNIRNQEAIRTCKLYDDAETEMAKEDPATRDRLAKQWRKELDQLELTLKIGTGNFIGMAIFVILGIIALAICSNLDVLWMGIALLILFIGCGCIGFFSAVSKAKKDLANNKAMAVRLNKKLNDLSK